MNSNNIDITDNDNAVTMDVDDVGDSNEESAQEINAYNDDMVIISNVGLHVVVPDLLMTPRTTEQQTQSDIELIEGSDTTDTNSIASESNSGRFSSTITDEATDSENVEDLDENIIEDAADLITSAENLIQDQRYLIANVGNFYPRRTVDNSESVDEAGAIVDSSKIDQNVKKRRLSNSDDASDDEDGRLCPICFDDWTNSGDHRICSLKCGHLFGYKCVNRWLSSQANKTCPTCKKKVNRGDLRYIYAKKLIAVDTIELEGLKKDLERVQEEKNRLALDLTKQNLRERVLKQEIEKLKLQIRNVTSGSSNSVNQFSNSNKTFRNVTLYMDKSMDICSHSMCRVFDVNNNRDLIFASTMSPTPVFPGYGLRKIHMSNYKVLDYISLHTQQIRDLAFHSVNDWLLSVSMDKSCKLLNTQTNSVISVTKQNMPLWSCCWDANNQNYFYVGTQSGIVYKYDVRQVNDPVCDFSVPNDMSPVVSVASIPTEAGSFGGVISCKLNSIWFFENLNESHKQHLLGLDGPFISMKYNHSSKLLLVSSRPNNQIAYARHTVNALSKNENGDVNYNIVHTFEGGGMQKLLSKSSFVQNNTDEYVAAYEETSKKVYLWSVNTGEKAASVFMHDTVLDLKGVETKNGNYLVSLTQKKISFFKFTN